MPLVTSIINGSVPRPRRFPRNDTRDTLKNTKMAAPDFLGSPATMARKAEKIHDMGKSYKLAMGSRSPRHNPPSCASLPTDSQLKPNCLTWSILSSPPLIQKSRLPVGHHVLPSCRTVFCLQMRLLRPRSRPMRKLRPKGPRSHRKDGFGWLRMQCS